MEKVTKNGSKTGAKDIDLIQVQFLGRKIIMTMGMKKKGVKQIVRRSPKPKTNILGRTVIKKNHRIKKTIIKSIPLSQINLIQNLEKQVVLIKN